MLKKSSLGLKKRFYLGLIFIGHLFLEKMYFEKSSENGQISPKNKEVNLNFLTILDHFWDFIKWLKKPSLGLKKRFYLDFSFVGRPFLEKMDFQKSPKMAKFRQKVKRLTLTFCRFWTISEIFLKCSKKLL